MDTVYLYIQAAGVALAVALAVVYKILSIVLPWIFDNVWNLFFVFWALYVAMTLDNIRESMDSLKKMYRDRS